MIDRTQLLCDLVFVKQRVLPLWQQFYYIRRYFGLPDSLSLWNNMSYNIIVIAFEVAIIFRTIPNYNTKIQTNNQTQSRLQCVTLL
jgi:hypothetical protein